MIGTQPGRSARVVKHPLRIQVETGASMVEYALIVALIAIIAIAGVRVLGVSTSDTFVEASRGVSDAPGTLYKEAGVEGQFTVSFKNDHGAVDIESVNAPGWTHTVTRDTPSRKHVTLTNTTTGERYVVKGWNTNKGKLKTRVKEL